MSDDAFRALFIDDTIAITPLRLCAVLPPRRAHQMTARLLYAHEDVTNRFLLPHTSRRPRLHRPHDSVDFATPPQTASCLLSDSIFSILRAHDSRFEYSNYADVFSMMMPAASARAIAARRDANRPASTHLPSSGRALRWRRDIREASSHELLPERARRMLIRHDTFVDARRVVINTILE
jgi:hypothetical protein